MKKARALYEVTKLPVISDDTGLFVKSLNGDPGVYSARYAGKDGDSKANNEKLLKEMLGKEDRSAYFKTVICFIDQNGEEYFAKGILDGEIAEKSNGLGGFGYDALFIFDGKRTLSEVSQDEKNKISHRAKAVNELKKILTK